jgi:hypothetical protein
VSVAVVVTLSDDQLAQIAELAAVRAAQIVQQREAVASWPRWLDSKAAATYISAPVSRIHDLVALRRLEPRRDGRRLLFDREDLDRYVEGGSHPVSTPGESPADRQVSARASDSVSVGRGQS